MVTSNISTITVANPPALAIGNTNYPTTKWDGSGDPIPFMDDPKMTWNWWGKPPTKHNTTNCFQKYELSGTYKLTDLAWVKSRFDLAVTYKANYDYGTWLLVEERFHPSAISACWQRDTTSGWLIDGKATFVGIEVKLLKTWIIEDKGLVWNQSWWDNYKTAAGCSQGDYNDPLVREWSIYYGYGLYRAWHTHMRNLGRKSAITTMFWNGTPQSQYDTQFKNRFYPSPIWQYIITNYDLINCYQYPQNMAEVQNSINQVKYLRQTLGYKGKISLILTTSFRSMNNPPWQEAVAWEEFKGVAPYVDVIMAYGHAQDPRTFPAYDQTLPAIYYPEFLIKFLNNYNSNY